ncbi:MAG: aldehyde ferredoxin oxidoreductase C-terminal domain-containing protein [Halobacteriales archaeon]|nr:aldehyde ferredoxin oxidoreductase C-terminal domain-containing protein [Halobacteriales archaeon]
MLHAKGPLCSIDLTNHETHTEDVDDVLSSFIGGRGVATKLAHDRIPFDVDPLGPENRLYLTTGPMQMSLMSFTGRMNATAVSPLSTGLVSSNAGGFLSRNFTGAGNAVVELVGRSDELVAVHVTDEGVEIEPVPELKEAPVPEVTEYMNDHHGLEAEHIAAIGPAGENLVRFAAIMTTESRAFGRGGLGAVMGSKNVKAITFEGDSAPEIEIPDISAEIHRDAAQSDSIMKRQGTASVTDLANELGTFPSWYFEETSFDGYEQINGDAVEGKKYKKGTCSACAFACKLPTKDEATGLETEGPEFETIMAFGGNCAVDDIVSVMQSNELCDTYGMDTISCGNAVAAYLKANDEFGNDELIHELVEKIAYREEEGDLLAEGIHRFHDELDVKDWTVKGMSFSAHDGRSAHGQGLSFATANRGADHMYSTFYAWEYPLVSNEEAVPMEGFDGKVPLIVEQEQRRALEDCGVICRFSRGMQSEDRLETLFDAEYEELLDVGERTITLERHFNNERGVDREDDTLPYDLPAFEQALEEYYDVHGWNDDGTVPEDAIVAD